MGKFVPKGQSYLVRRLIRTCRISSGVSFFRFQSKMPSLGKFGETSQNYHLKLKFSTYNNLDMQNSMVMLILSVFNQKYLFLKFGPKIQNYQFQLKFGT